MDLNGVPVMPNSTGQLPRSVNTRGEILAACDLSEYSLPVLRMAARMAADLKRELLVVHVVHRRDIDSVTYAMRMEGLFSEVPSPEEFVRKLTQERVREIQNLMTKAGAGRFLTKLEIVVGYPFEALMKLIEARDAYMVIIGTKGRGRIDGLLAGSTAEKLLSRCPVPLLCVPQAAEFSRPENDTF